LVNLSAVDVELQVATLCADVTVTLPRACTGLHVHHVVQSHFNCHNPRLCNAFKFQNYVS